LWDGGAIDVAIRCFGKGIGIACGTKFQRRETLIQKEMHDGRGARRRQLPVGRESRGTDGGIIRVAFDSDLIVLELVRSEIDRHIPQDGFAGLAQRGGSAVEEGGAVYFDYRNSVALRLDLGHAPRFREVDDFRRCAGTRVTHRLAGWYLTGLDWEGVSADARRFHARRPFDFF